MNSPETWRPIHRLSSYEVSDLGRVRRGRRIRILQRDSKGYLRVSIWLGGRSQRFSVAGLVAEAFHGPRPAGCVVRHLNGDRTDNRATNLTYGTPEENEADKATHGTKVRGMKHHSAKLTEAQVGEIRRRYIPRDPQHGTAALGREFHISTKTAHDIVHRRRWKFLP